MQIQLKYTILIKKAQVLLLGSKPGATNLDAFKSTELSMTAPKT